MSVIINAVGATMTVASVFVRRPIALAIFAVFAVVVSAQHDGHSGGRSLVLDGDGDDNGSSTKTAGPEWAGNASTLPGRWLADMFYRALADFTVDDPGSSDACRKQTRTYVGHLKNNTYWAVKMHDSTSQYPNGLLVGASHQMGIYDECIDVHHPVQGKYCMTAIRLATVAGQTFNLIERDETETYDNAWNEILGFIDYGDRYRRNEVKIGVCIPESCSAENLEQSLQNKLDKIFLPHKIQAQVKVEPIMCSTDKSFHPYDTGYYVTSVIMNSVIVICFLSTLVNIIILYRNGKEDNQRTVPEFVYWFSVIHNGRNLIKYNKDNELNIFNGIKTYMMGLMLFAHRYMYYTRQPVAYPIRSEMVYKIGPGEYGDTMLTGSNSVDIFFYITGFLLYVLVKPQIIKRGSGLIQIPLIIAFKYLRFMPAYAAMMLLTAYSIPFMNSGPFWAFNMWPEAERCRNYWWANFLAISNFIEVDNQCLIVGWYVSCLLQFLVIGVVIIYICVKNQKIGVIVTSLLLCVSLIIPFVLTYTTQSYSIVRVLYPFLENPNSSYEYRNLYRPFYVRAIPFYVGLMAGIVVEKLKTKKFKMSRFVVQMSTIFCIAICYFIQKYGTAFYQRHRPYNAFEQATYATVKHCSWTIFFFWITICHFNSGWGPIEKMFNNRIVTVFGRLTYTVYLVNMTIIMTIVARQTTPVSSTIEDMVDTWITSIVRSYVTGLMLYLTVEAPFNTILKTIFFRSSNSDNKKENVCNKQKNFENESHL